MRASARVRTPRSLAPALLLLALATPLAAQRPVAKWALMDPSGRIVLPFRDYVSPIAEGLVAASSDDGKRYGYMETNGTWVIQPTFKDATPFHQGRALVKGDAGWIVIDRQGAKVADAPGMKDVAWSIAQSWDAEMPGYYAVKGTNEKSGVVNAAGELVVPLAHSQFVLSSGGVITMADQAGDAWTLTYYDAATKQKLFGPVPRGDAWSTVLLAYREGRAGAWNEKEKRYGYVDRTGAWRIKPKYVAIDPFFEGRAVVSTEKGQISIIDTTGTELAEFKNHTCSSGYRNGLALVGLKERNPILVDRAGKQVAQLEDNSLTCRIRLNHAEGLVFETLGGDTVLKAFDARTGRTSMPPDRLRDVSAIRMYQPEAGLFLVRGWGTAPAPQAVASGGGADGGFRGLRRSVDNDEFGKLTEPSYHEYYVYRAWMIDGAYQRGMKLMPSMFYSQMVLIRVKDGRGVRTMDEILKVAGCTAPPNGRFVAAQVMYPKKPGENVYEITKRFSKYAFDDSKFFPTNEWACAWSLLVDVD